MTTRNKGYICAQAKVDDNGNWYYLQLSEAWATEELARRWANYAGLDGCEVVPASQRRLFDDLHVAG